MLCEGIEPSSLDSKSNAFPFKLTEHVLLVFLNKINYLLFFPSFLPSVKKLAVKKLAVKKFAVKKFK